MAIIPKTISDILQKILTKDERDQAMAAVEVLENAFYQLEKNGLENVLKRSVPSELAKAIHAGLAEAAKAGGEEARKEFLKTLKESFNDLRVLRLEFAIEPTEELIENVSDWVLHELGKGIVLEVEHNPSVLGGATIVFGGRYTEKTLNASLQNLFESEKEELVKELTR